MRFAADVSSAARALVRQPTMPLFSILLWWLPILMTPSASASRKLNPWVFVVDVALMLFLAGWIGAERIFFLRHFRGQPVTLAHLLKLAKPFMGRFLVLGLVVGLAFIPWSVLLLIILGGFKKAHGTKLQVGVTVFFVGLDLALTFVPAALAFTTSSVRRALRIGFAMIRQTWPRSALYVLCPPLALGMNSLVNPSELPMLRLIFAACLAVVALLAKGATVAFYIREQPVHSDDGAAYFTDIDERAAGAARSG